MNKCISFLDLERLDLVKPIMSINNFVDQDTYCVYCNKKNKFKDHVILRCNHNIHYSCVDKLFTLNDGKKSVNIKRDELCFDKTKIIYPNNKIMTVNYVTSYSDNTIQCPAHSDMWPFENNTYYIIKNQSLVKVNYFLMMLESPNNENKLYHQICSNYDIVHYMNIEKQKEYFMLNDESKFMIGPTDYTVYFMIKQKELFNHLVIKQTKRRITVLIYPESRCPACLYPLNTRFKHASLIEYLKLCSESTACIHEMHNYDVSIDCS